MLFEFLFRQKRFEKADHAHVQVETLLEVDQCVTSRNRMRSDLSFIKGIARGRCVSALRSLAFCFLLFVYLLTCVSCEKSSQTTGENSKAMSAIEATVTELIASEDLILDLTPQLKMIALWIEQRAVDPEVNFPGWADLAVVRGLAAPDSENLFRRDDAFPDFLEIAEWPIESEASPKVGYPWKPMDVFGVQWETMKFGVLSGSFKNENVFLIHSKVEGRGKSPSAIFGIKGHQDFQFEQENGIWKLTEWLQEDLVLERTARPLFREVLSEVVADAETLKEIRRSHKDEIIVKSSRKGGKITLPVPLVADWEELPSNHVFPSVSVVDYNSDGLDDLFLTSRWAATQMLEKQPDGTYVDVAERIGLREEYMVNCALFMDVDNDGDKDAILGRPMEPAKYFLNESGVYRNVTKTHSDLGKQFFVCGISATDVNRDGLLDVYLSSYPALNKASLRFQDVFLGSEEREIYDEKRKTMNRWLDLPGSANVLLMNRGDGRLERVPYDDDLSQWRRSFQSAWADFDEDGDDDLYICNDFSPDALLRNDTPVGAAQPVFVNVTDRVITNRGIGFGMGASFGDFDQDGDLDLYVSNMFSKAGRRIASKLGKVDERIEVAARGSFLYVNENGEYAQRAGDDEGEFKVHQVGWSFGGQFVDFNNDGRLDLYVPSGYYTAPAEIATEVDT